MKRAWPRPRSSPTRSSAPTSRSARKAGAISTARALAEALIKAGLDRDCPPFSEGPYAAAEGGSLTLDATASTDPDLPSDVLSYAWDFDADGLYDDATGAPRR